MAKISMYDADNTFLFGYGDNVDGAYRLYLHDIKSPMTLHFAPENITSGTAMLSVDGENGANNAVDLTVNRIKAANFAARFVDVDISGVNAGGKLVICVL